MTIVSLPKPVLHNPYKHSIFMLKDLLPNVDIGAQVYGVPTYDSLIGWILDDPEVRSSFFRAFIPGINVTSSERLDENMNPLEEFQLLHEFVNKNDTQKNVACLNEPSELEARIKETNQTQLIQNKKDTEFLKKLLKNFGDIIKAFPSQRYKFGLKFLCQLDTGEYALVEIQTTRENYWYRRAFAYVAAFYGKQIREGEDVKDFKKVIGIYIKRGATDANDPWIYDPDEFLEHYKVQEQLIKEPRFIDDLDVYQYSLGDFEKFQ